MWGLHVTGGFKQNQLTAALADKDQYIRAWAIQLLCEDQAPSVEALAAFGQMAQKDPSPVVRLYLASALQRINEESKWKIAGELMMHALDSADHNLPKMIWFGMENLVAKNPTRALELASQSKIPMLAQFIARRAVDADALEVLTATIGKAPATQISLMEGMRDGLEGRYDLTAPANWKAVYTKLQALDARVAGLSRELAGKFGDSEAAKQSLATLHDKKAPIEMRRKALLMLAERQRKELVDQIPALLEDKDLRIDAIRAIAGYDQEDMGKLLLKKYASFTPAEKLETMQTLSSRPRYGWLLTRAIQDKTVPRPDVPAYVARQLRRVVGSGFVEVWGPIDALAAGEQAAEYNRYRKLLTDKALASASAQKGRVLFTRTCGSCHKMYGEGGTIGPDITGSNRGNVDYLLSN
jgi:mono/diheme cytochrome c family protein